MGKRIHTHSDSGMKDPSDLYFVAIILKDLDILDINDLELCRRSTIGISAGEISLCQCGCNLG